MISGAPSLLGKELPGFIRDLLGSAPKIGEGVNDWIFRVARLLHPYRHEGEIVAIIAAATHGIRIRVGEIERQVRNAKAAAWQPGQPVAGPQAFCSRWPAQDAKRRARIIGEGPNTVELCDLSPVAFDPGEPGNVGEILEMLFSTTAVPDPLLCTGKSNADFATRLLSVWLDEPDLSGRSLIVPSPMRTREGRTKEGKVSEHCLDNTGERRFLVVEFDQGTTDEHAALLWHLAGYGPLTMAVHSGGKSMHGWFFCHGQDDAAMRRFMEYAVSIGADDATWTRSQFVRLPSGQRENGARQNVLYFDPASIQRTEGTDAQ